MSHFLLVTLSNLHSFIYAGVWKRISKLEFNLRFISMTNHLFYLSETMTFYAISFEKWHFFNAFILFCNFTFLFVNYEKKQSFDQKLQAFSIQGMKSKRFFLDTVMVKIIHKFICYSKSISQKCYNVDFTKK